MVHSTRAFVMLIKIIKGRLIHTDGDVYEGDGHDNKAHECIEMWNVI